MIETDYIKEGGKLLGDVQKIATFKEFSEEDLVLLLKMSKVRKYEAGEAICKEGFVDNWVYFLLQGAVRVGKKGSTLADLDERGEIFGEMGLIDGFPRSANIVALKTTVCLALDTQRLEQLSGNEKLVLGYVLSRAFAVRLAARLRVANEQLTRGPEKFEWKKLKKKFF